jgi:hypothetical protein
MKTGRDNVTQIFEAVGAGDEQAAAKIASTGSESTLSDVEGESLLRKFSNGKNEAC